MFGSKASLLLRKPGSGGNDRCAGGSTMGASGGCGMGKLRAPEESIDAFVAGPGPVGGPIVLVFDAAEGSDDTEGGADSISSGGGGA